MVENLVKDEVDGVVDDELMKMKEVSNEVLIFLEVDDGLSDFYIRLEGCKVIEGVSILNEERFLFMVFVILMDELNEDFCEESENFIGKCK